MSSILSAGYWSQLACTCDNKGQPTHGTVDDVSTERKSNSVNSGPGIDSHVNNYSVNSGPDCDLTPDEGSVNCSNGEGEDELSDGHIDDVGITSDCQRLYHAGQTSDNDIEANLTKRLGSLTIKELKYLAGQIGLKVRGNKDIYVSSLARIQDIDIYITQMD